MRMAFLGLGYMRVIFCFCEKVRCMRYATLQVLLIACAVSIENYCRLLVRIIRPI